MKKCLIAVICCAAWNMAAAQQEESPNPQATMNDLFRKGLFAEEGLRNTPEAIGYYRQVLDAFTKHARTAASATFRLAECYRKEGNAEEAIRYYQAVIRDFDEEETLVRLCRENLKTLGLSEVSPTTATRPD